MRALANSGFRHSEPGGSVEEYLAAVSGHPALCITVSAARPPSVEAPMRRHLLLVVLALSVPTTGVGPGAPGALRRRGIPSSSW